MLNPIGAMNSLTFKAIYKGKEENYSETQKAILEDILKKLKEPSKDFYERTLEQRLEDDYETDINLAPATDKKSVYMSVSTGRHTTPFGVYNLDNTSSIPKDLDEMFPAVSEPSNVDKTSGLSTIALIVGAFLVTLFGAIKCSNTEAVAKSTEKVVEQVKTTNNAQKIAKNTFKLFK